MRSRGKGVVGFFLALLVISSLSCGTSDEEVQSSTAVAPTPTAAPSIPEGAFRVLNKDPGGSGEYQFDPADFTFTVGQEVTFAITAESEFHTFDVEELGISEEVDAGETTVFTYTFDKAGTYKLLCIPHETLGMVGQIVVQ